MNPEPFTDDEFEDALADNYWNEVVSIDGIIFEITNEVDMFENDIYQAKKNTNGTVDFLVQFYNGSQPLSEAIEQALKENNIRV
jgi:hypothetical protein